MLYDIYYTDRSFDRARDLPARAERGAYALNVDWDGHVYVAQRGKWVEGRREGDRFVPTVAPPRDAFKTRFHRDQTVTIWDVHFQGWVRTSRPRDSILASLDPRERARVIRHCGIA